MSLSDLTFPAASEKKENGFSLSRALERAAHWLPTQGPIKDFVHHNTLHAFQHLPFHTAVSAASELYGAAGYLDGSAYLKAYRAGKISEAALARVIAGEAQASEERAELRKKMLSPGVLSPARPKGIARSGLRARWKQRGVDLDALVHPTLFKLLSNYLDQGIAVWRMPHANESFWEAVRRILKESRLPLPPLSDEICRVALSQDAGQAAHYCLKRLVGHEPFYERYLLEMLLSHPGWSGMVHMVETVPGSLLDRRRLALEEVVALELTLELGFVTRALGTSFAPIASEGEALRKLPMEAPSPPSESQRILQLWHEALEGTLYDEVLSSLERHVPQAGPESPSVQAFFCIDDRMESIRRHLEAVDGSIATFATAGFFGIDFLFQGFEDSYPIQSCPVAVKPRHLVRESRLRLAHDGASRFNRHFRIDSSSNTLFRGWLITQTLGLWHSIRLAVQVFTPSPGPTREKALSFVEANTRLHLLRESDKVTEDGYWLGYTFPEMAERVFSVLHSSGCTQRFAELVLVIGHGSSSANNPHFAAYDCGACSGKPGAPNARAFAWMANRPEVRALLREKGIAIPGTTWFVAALQDTCRDEIQYFDLDPLPESHQRALRKFDVGMQKALRLNAKERCRKFEMVDPDISPTRALKTVRERSASIFEPRPELNHATNAICIVGRREMTRGLSLDRRAFLSSYDPESDPDGECLASQLTALVPVCAGINLEYYFSRVDNNVYGAGTKLPHNVVSLVGVANGVDGDLLTGLPSQMVEPHDPIRLLVVVEQTPEVALKAVTQNPKVLEWVKNDWIRLACLSPAEKKSYVFEKGAFVRSEGSKR